MTWNIQPLSYLQGTCTQQWVKDYIDKVCSYMYTTRSLLTKCASQSLELIWILQVIQPYIDEAVDLKVGIYRLWSSNVYIKDWTTLLPNSLPIVQTIWWQLAWRKKSNGIRGKVYIKLHECMHGRRKTPHLPHVFQIKMTSQAHQVLHRKHTSKEVSVRSTLVLCRLAQCFSLSTDWEMWCKVQQCWGAEAAPC